MLETVESAYLQQGFSGRKKERRERGVRLCASRGGKVDAAHNVKRNALSSFSSGWLIKQIEDNRSENSSLGKREKSLVAEEGKPGGKDVESSRLRSAKKKDT